ncbi:MAG TPA: adenylate/guanylate cyclase domain-containing protein [Gaiellaceae bacterium]|nr:adenylate/guanylate cyclase domain-containing protein [Gaiellaceae bacterium]
MRPQADTRTLAFLFTDIEGSTALWERFPEAMGSSLERHDAILRGAVEDAAGEVVKTTGDGLMAVFESARDGVRACLRAQLALAGEPWNEAGPLRVRMGLHAGEAAASGGDYHGPAVNRAARIMAAGHGGQVLLSAVAVALVVDQLPDGSTLLDLGEHRLRGLGRAEHLFQLVHPGLQASFPSLATIHDGTRDLPLEVSGFVGREAELEQLGELLRDDAVRLVTLLGPGGIGKTRLAVRAAAESRERFPHGVFFVDLESARGTDAVLVAVARSVGLADTSPGSQLEELVERLRDRRCLIVLDNFEQVTAAASTVARLLDDCPGLQLLVTSREALRVRGEHRFPVPPLALPDAALQQPSAGQLMRYEAVQLFVERAQAIRPDFELTDENAAAVAEICLRLDGLPLAIELATARIGLFSPGALRERLGSRLTLLRSGARDLPERQQTLRATIDWSYELLEPGEQRLFELLSAFAGAGLEAVEAVAAALDGRLEGLDPLDGVASLVDKSLLRQVGDGDGEPRFVMLETIREYAADRLEDLPDFDAAARRAHAVYFADLVLGQTAALTGAERGPALVALAAETENLRLCWHYWVGEGDLERLDGLVDGLWAFYDGQGWYRETVELASDLLDVLAATPATPERVAAEATLRMSRARALLAMEGYTSAVETEYTRALELVESEGDLPQLFPVLRSLGTFYGFRAEFEKAAGIGREIQALADRQDDPSMRVDGDLMVGYTSGFQGDLHAGAETLDAAIARFEAQPYRSSRLRLGSDPRVPCLTTSAFFLWLLGYPDRSLGRADRAVELASTLEHPSTRVYALFHSGLLHLWRQEPELVRSRALEMLQIADGHHLQIWTAIGTFLLGAASTALGESEEGLSRMREGRDLYQDMKTPPVFWPMLLSVHARACAGAGLPDEGLAFIDQALGLIGESRMPLLPELFAVKGDLLAAAGGAAEGGPATWYRRALESARSFDARMLELRAAIALCRLAQPAAEVERARGLLASVHATFTEGFATADLAEARALLEG